MHGCIPTGFLEGRITLFAARIKGGFPPALLANRWCPRNVVAVSQKADWRKSAWRNQSSQGIRILCALLVHGPEMGREMHVKLANPTAAQSTLDVSNMVDNGHWIDNCFGMQRAKREQKNRHGGIGRFVHMPDPNFSLSSPAPLPKLQRQPQFRPFACACACACAWLLDLTLDQLRLC